MMSALNFNFKQQQQKIDPEKPVLMSHSEAGPLKHTSTQSHTLKTSTSRIDRFLFGFFLFDTGNDNKCALE